MLPSLRAPSVSGAGACAQKTIFEPSAGAWTWWTPPVRRSYVRSGRRSRTGSHDGESHEDHAPVFGAQAWRTSALAARLPRDDSAATAETRWCASRSRVGPRMTIPHQRPHGTQVLGVAGAGLQPLPGITEASPSLDSKESRSGASSRIANRARSLQDDVNDCRKRNYGDLESWRRRCRRGVHSGGRPQPGLSQPSASGRRRGGLPDWASLFGPAAWPSSTARAHPGRSSPMAPPTCLSQRA